MEDSGHDPLSCSSLLCNAPNSVPPTCDIYKDVARPWKGIRFKQQLFLQNFLLPSISVSYIMWWCESHLRHPAFLLLWRCSTLNRCFWRCSPFLLVVFKIIRKLFITQFEWIASIYPRFPTSAESYAIYCILSRKTGMKYSGYIFFVIYACTHTHTHRHIYSCIRSLNLQVMHMYPND